MAAMKKIAGLIAGLSAVAAVGVAVAQSVPPNPFVPNHAIAAGQQNLHLSWQGETGTPWGIGREAVAEITPAPVAVAPAPVQEVAQAPAPVQEMGAAPAPVQEQPAPMPAPRSDRG